MKKKTIKKVLAIISIVVILFGFNISVISLSSVKVSNRGSSHASNSAYVISYLDSYPKLQLKNYTSEPVLSDEQAQHLIEAFRNNSIKPH